MESTLSVVGKTILEFYPLLLALLGIVFLMVVVEMVGQFFAARSAGGSGGEDGGISPSSGSSPSFPPISSIPGTPVDMHDLFRELDREGGPLGIHPSTRRRMENSSFLNTQW